MKLIMESWRTFAEETEKDCGYLYLSENRRIKFSEALFSLTESEEKQNIFLENWEKSADIVLSKDVLDEGVMDLVSQAASILKNVAGKSWETVSSVASKVLSFIERFKEKNPKMYKAIKIALIAIAIVAAIYAIAQITGMTSVTSAMTSLARFQWPDVTISDLVHDVAGQPTVEALRGLRDLLAERAGEYLNSMISSDVKWIHELGLQLQDRLPKAIQQTATDAFWEQAFGGP